MELKLLDPAIEEDAYCWLISIGSTMVGVHVDAGWCMRINGSVLMLDEESKFVPLGPLLEMTASEFYGFLDRAALANPSFGRQITDFPREALLKHVFYTSYSSYWPERALAWLAVEQGLWPKFLNELLLFSKNKAMPQQARQQAQKMIKAVTNS